MVTVPWPGVPCCSAALCRMVAGRVSLAAGTVSDDQLTIGFIALVFVSLMGLLMLTAVVAGARYVRRLNRRPTRPSQMASDRWYEKPLIEPTTESSHDEISDIE